MSSKASPPTLPARVAMMPIPEQVLLPGFPQPYPVFETRYMTLLSELVKLRPEDRWVAVPQMVTSYGNHYRGRPSIHAIATVGHVVSARQTGEGHAQMTVMGVARVRLEEVASSKPYRLASCALIADEPQADADQWQEAERLLQASVDVMKALGPLAAGLEDLLRDRADISALVYRLGSVFIHNPKERRALLEDRCLSRRVDTVVEAMTDLMSMAAMASLSRKGPEAA